MKVLFFAQIRDFTRCASLEIPAAESGAALWSGIEEHFPGIEKFRGTTRLARNGTFVSDSERFEPADEIALIPPVSGG